MSGFKFEEAEYPTTSPSKVINPYTEMVKVMAQTETTRKVTVEYKTADDRKAAASLINQVQAAGRDLNVTVNKTIVEDKAKGSATIYFKTREAIKRTRLNTNN